MFIPRPFSMPAGRAARRARAAPGLVFFRAAAADAYARNEHAVFIEHGDAAGHGSHAFIHEIGQTELFSDKAFMQGGGGTVHFGGRIGFASGHVLDARMNAGHTQKGRQGRVRRRYGQTYGGSPRGELVELLKNLPDTQVKGIADHDCSRIRDKGRAASEELHVEKAASSAARCGRNAGRAVFPVPVCRAEAGNVKRFHRQKNVLFSGGNIPQKGGIRPDRSCFARPPREWHVFRSHRCSLVGRCLGDVFSRRFFGDFRQKSGCGRWRQVLSAVLCAKMQ